MHGLQVEHLGQSGIGLPHGFEGGGVGLMAYRSADGGFADGDGEDRFNFLGKLEPVESVIIQ